MASTTKPPPVNIEPENCPEAVINWYDITSHEHTHKRQRVLRRDLSSQAKKHLCFLGWTFWHAEKKDKWELRYSSPITGKSYVSLRRACHACIQEGGCNDGNPQINLQNNNVDREPSPSAPKKPRKSKNKKARVCKKRQKSDDDDDYELGEASSSMNNNKALPPIRKRTREAEATKGSDQFLKQKKHRGAIIPWLIDNNVVALYSLVFCRNANNMVKKGKLCRSGIACECCGMLFSLSRFEAHAGCRKHRPSSTIFLEDGRSLLDCRKDALSSQENKLCPLVKEEEKDHREYQNDNICAVCYFGGELVLCDRCPSSFHLSCLGIEHVPDGDWFCPACCCKICKGPRCNTEEKCDENVDANRVMVCHQCEGRYHTGCLKALTYTKIGKDQEDRVDNENENWFCSGDCENIFLTLQKLVGKAINVGGADNVTWTLLKAVKKSDTDDSCGESDLTRDEVEDLSQNESKLSEALNVLHESFNQVIDTFFERDMISDIVFSRGSEINRLNLRGFYTVVLERGEEVVSVATLRIFGKRVAEIPFVATRMQCRKQGLCGILMSEIEKYLSYLGVQEIVLPSSPNVIDTWTNSFNFKKMTLSDRLQFLDHVFLDFEDTIMCHKPLVVKQTVI